MGRLGVVVGVSVALAVGPSVAVAQSKTFTLNGDFDGGVFDRTVDTNPVHQVVLGPTTVSKSHRVWASNYLYGWVVALDNLNGKQLARYDSSLQFINGVSTGAPPPNEYCDFASTGNCPHFYAVDQDGDLWVVNSAYGKQGTLSKIAGDPTHCLDRNNNGVIDSSLDANNDGQASVVTGAGEYFGQNDECVLSTVSVGPNNIVPRGITVDRRGKVWVATHNDGKIHRFGSGDPSTIEATLTVGGNPFALSAAREYVFVAKSSGNAVQRVHATALTVQSLTCAGLAGVHSVVADPAGDIVWLGAYFTGTGVYRANFANNTCTYINTGSQVTAVTIDLAGNIWAIGYNTNSVHKLSPAGVLLGTYPSFAGLGVGLSVDFQNNIWILGNQPNPVAAKINANTGALIGAYTLSGFGVPNPSTYGFGDLTGVQADRIAPYQKLGSWSGTFDGGAAGIPWATVSWNVEPQGATPAETAIQMSARAADTLAQLPGAAFIPVTNGAAVSGVVGRFVEVRAVLSGPGFVTPSLSDVTVNGPCATPGPSCCLIDANCDDGAACTFDVCAGPGQACTHAPIPGCCGADADCLDADACTIDACDVPAQQCTHTPQAGCCNTALDCNDGAACTVDACSGPGGSCSHPTISQCCVTDADCDDGAGCTVDACGVNNVCLHTGVPGCCATDADCLEVPDDLCSANTCDAATGACSAQSLLPLGCCNSSADCDDGDACTVDSCSGPGGVCAHAEQPGCCTPNDPEVGAPCDVPVAPLDSPPCKAGALACVAGALVCQGAVVPTVDATCDGGEGGGGGSGGGGAGAGGGGGEPNGGCSCGVAAGGPALGAFGLGLALAAIALRRRR